MELAEVALKNNIFNFDEKFSNWYVEHQLNNVCTSISYFDCDWLRKKS